MIKNIIKFTIKINLIFLLKLYTLSSCKNDSIEAQNSIKKVKIKDAGQTSKTPIRIFDVENMLTNTIEIIGYCDVGPKYFFKKGTSKRTLKQRTIRQLKNAKRELYKGEGYRSWRVVLEYLVEAKYYASLLDKQWIQESRGKYNWKKYIRYIEKLLLMTENYSRVPRPKHTSIESTDIEKVSATESVNDTNTKDDKLKKDSSTNENHLNKNEEEDEEEITNGKYRNNGQPKIKSHNKKYYPHDRREYIKKRQRKLPRNHKYRHHYSPYDHDMSNKFDHTREEEYFEDSDRSYNEQYSSDDEYEDDRYENIKTEERYY